MVGKRKRQWYAAYRIGDTEPFSLISALSLKAARSYVGCGPTRCKIMLAKTWQLVKALSGKPHGLGSRDAFAPNTLPMITDYNIISIVILN